MSNCCCCCSSVREEIFFFVYEGGRAGGVHCAGKVPEGYSGRGTCTLGECSCEFKATERSGWMMHRGRIQRAAFQTCLILFAFGLLLITVAVLPRSVHRPTLFVVSHPLCRCGQSSRPLPHPTYIHILTGPVVRPMGMPATHCCTAVVVVDFFVLYFLFRRERMRGCFHHRPRLRCLPLSLSLFLSLSVLPHALPCLVCCVRAQSILQSSPYAQTCLPPSLHHLVFFSMSLPRVRSPMIFSLRSVARAGLLVGCRRFRLQNVRLVQGE